MGLASACIRLDCREIREDEETRKKAYCCGGCGCVVFIIALSLILHATVGGRVFLSDDEQVLLKGRTSKSVENGPGTVYFNPFVTQAEKRNAIVLTETQYLHLTNVLTGEKRMVSGPQLVFRGAHDEAGYPSTKEVIKANQYLVVLSTTTGESRVIRGPAVFAPSPVEEMDLPVKDAFKLQRDEYIKLVDAATGAVRIERGEQLVFPTATETPNEIMTAVNVDADTAALVLDKTTGQQRLVTTPGKFFPTAHEVVLEERTLILVHPHEVAIVQDNQGVYTFYMGNNSDATDSTGQGTSFFLQPYQQLVVMYWKADGDDSDGSSSKEPIQKIDTRASYLSFGFNVRTSDNVQLHLNGNIFWQVRNPAKMIEMTADPRADVNNHARSTLQEEVSKVTLEKFMEEFSVLVKAAAERDSSFYDMRGVALLSLEVTGYTPTDEKTAETLQKIIEQTTDRINRLAVARSDSEVQREQLANDLALEEARSSLVKKQNEVKQLVEIAAQKLENEVNTNKVEGEVKLEEARKALVTAKAENEKLEALAEQAKRDAVENATLTNQVTLEEVRRQLVLKKKESDLVVAAAEGEAIGSNWANQYSAFLQHTVDFAATLSVSDRLELFKFVFEQDTTTKQLATSSSNLGQGNANLYLVPSEAGIRLNVGTSATGSTTTKLVVPEPPSPSPAPLPLLDVGSGADSAPAGADVGSADSV